MPSVDVRYEIALVELAAANDRLLTSQLVATAGLSAGQWKRLRGDDIWIPVVPGQWRHTATALTWEMKVLAGARWLGPGAALYGVSAARWLGIDTPMRDSVEFVVPRSRRHLAPWIDLHTTLQWRRTDHVTVDGVRTCTAARAIVDMARREDPHILEAAIDSAIRLRRTSVPTLRRQLANLAGPGHAGVATLRILMLDSGGESHLERCFLRLVRRARLPRPSSQVVHRSGGRTAARVDFEFVGSGVIVEVSGRLGHTSDRDRQRDARRRNHLQSIGKTVLEFTSADVIGDPAYVLATLAEHLHVIP